MSPGLVRVIKRTSPLPGLARGRGLWVVTAADRPALIDRGAHGLRGYNTGSESSRPRMVFSGAKRHRPGQTSSGDGSSKQISRLGSDARPGWLDARARRCLRQAAVQRQFVPPGRRLAQPPTHAHAYARNGTRKQIIWTDSPALEAACGLGPPQLQPAA